MRDSWEKTKSQEPLDESGRVDNYVTPIIPNISMLYYKLYQSIYTSVILCFQLFYADKLNTCVLHPFKGNNKVCKQNTNTHCAAGIAQKSYKALFSLWSLNQKNILKLIKQKSHADQKYWKHWKGSWNQRREIIKIMLILFCTNSKINTTFAFRLIL